MTWLCEAQRSWEEVTIFTDPFDLCVPQVTQGVGALAEKLPQRQPHVALVPLPELRGHLGGPHQDVAVGRHVPGQAGQQAAVGGGGGGGGGSRLNLLLLREEPQTKALFTSCFV